MNNGKDMTYAIQNLAVLGIILGIFPFFPEQLTTVSFLVGLCMLAYRWFKYKQKPDCCGKIVWTPILGMLFFVAMLILASRFSLDVHKSSNVAYNYFKYMKPALMLMVLMNDKPAFLQAIAYGLLSGAMYICLYTDPLAKEYFLLHMNTGHPLAVLGHRNLLSSFLTILLPFSFWYLFNRARYMATKIIWIGAIVVTFITLVAAQSRGAFIAVFITAIIFVLLMFFNKTYDKTKTLTAILILAVITLGIFQFLPKDNHIWSLEKTVEYGQKPITHYNDNGRLYLYEGSINMIKDYPIFGVGLDNFNKVYVEHYMVPGAVEKNLPHAHNIVLAFLTTTGIVGLLGFLVSQVTYLCFLFKNRQISGVAYMALASMLIFFLHNMVDFLFYQYIIEITYWLILGTAYVLICLKKSEKGNKKVV
jgi:O-antigen ligase